MDSKIPERTERDTMGEVELPSGALYGASTQRAVNNFPVSGKRLPTEFIHSLGRIKKACALANRDAGLLDEQLASLINQVAEEIIEGVHDEQFVVDVFQTGSGTSTNMNANEVIANRCSQLAGKPLGSKKPVHPNDHANLSQSSNDVIPTALHVSVALSLQKKLKPALQVLEEALQDKAKGWAAVIKIGRTHLMDATPLTMGQVFSGYTKQANKGIQRADRAIKLMQELAIGGTAVGTGLNTPDGFGEQVCTLLREDTGIDFREAGNHFEAQAARDDAVEVAGILTSLAASLGKIANDIRLLGSGPRAGLSELRLPPVQPGSSIMPGKVNPVMCEMLIQVCHYVAGLCQTVARCGQDGQFELNVTLPLMASCLHDSIDCLANATNAFTQKCVVGLEVDKERCQTLTRESLMLVTALNPEIGYEKAAIVAKKAYEENKTLLDVVVEMDLISEDTARTILDPANFI